MASRFGMTRVRVLMALGVWLVLFGFMTRTAPAVLGADTALDGTVIAAGKPLAGAQVTLYNGTRTGAAVLGKATTGADGKFTIHYTPPQEGILYAEARGGSERLRLLAAAGVAGDAGALLPFALDKITLNELTTVASTFALAQFFRGADVAGVSPGLENAAATAFNLADFGTGAPGHVITDANNGANNDSLATLNSLSNLVALCSADAAGAPCTEFLQNAAPPGGSAASDTVQAVLNLVKNPTVGTSNLFTLSEKETLYAPALTAAPEAWLLALLFTDKNLYASGRIAFDARGNAWSNNNWQPGTTNGSNNINVLNPRGKPILGSPIYGGGLNGGGWGNAIAADGTDWVGNFGGNTVSRFSPDGKPLSPDTGWNNGGLNHPQGLAFDQKGNVWIANNYGHGTPGEGSVVVYPGGDPSKAIVITGGGINHPFAVQIDAHGNAWVTNAGDNGMQILTVPEAIANGNTGGSVTVITPDFKPTANSPITGDLLQFPLGLALDSQGNGWVNSFMDNTVTEIHADGTIAASHKLPGPFSPWGIAVDGADRIWVAGFSLPGVSLLCGENTAACPPGSKTGDRLSPELGFRTKAFQHLTSVQIDPSGNLWASNNWSTLQPPSGGVGVVELVGVAPPVCAPLLGLPQKPADGCPAVPATAPARSLPAAGMDAGAFALANVYLLLAAGLVLLTAGLMLRRRAW